MNSRKSGITLFLFTFSLVSFLAYGQPVSLAKADSPSEPLLVCRTSYRIMPLGDSITTGNSSGALPDEPASYISYRKDLWDSLNAAGYDVNFVGSQTNGQAYQATEGFDPNHEGHSGWRDDQIAAHIYDFLVANSADIILLHIGTNSLDTNPADVEQILDEIDRWEVSSGNYVTVLLARIIRRSPANSSVNTTVNQFNDNVAAMAQARTDDDVVIVNLETGAGIVYEVTPAGDMWDDKHPYTPGYTKMAALWMSTLSNLIQNCNHPPTATQPADQSNDEGESVSLQIQASDPDAGQTLTYSATDLPPGVSLNESSGLIGGTIEYAAAAGSPYSVQVKATDNGVPHLSDNKIFTWTVSNTNRAPSVTNPGNQSNDEGTTVSLDINAIDPDDDQITYSATGIPPGLRIDPTSGLITGFLDYGTSEGSPYLVTLTATDNGVPELSGTTTITWNVNSINRAPEIIQPGTQSGSEAQYAELQIQASDPDLSDTLFFQAGGLPEGMALDAASGLISGTLSYNASLGSPHQVTVTVSDDGLPVKNDSVTFFWQVTNVNGAPQIEPPDDQTHLEGQFISLQITASDPDQEDALIFGAIGLPAGLSINPANGLVSGTIATGAAGEYPVKITATDDGTPAKSAIVTFTWTVNEDNHSPEMTNPGRQTSVEGVSISLQIEANDPDVGDRLAFSAQGLPVGLAINPLTGLISGAIGFEASIGSPYQVTVTATDDSQPSLSQSVAFTWVIQDRTPFFLPVILH